MKKDIFKFLIIYDKQSKKSFIYYGNAIQSDRKEIENNFFIILGNPYYQGKDVNLTWIKNKIKDNKYDEIKNLDGSFTIIFIDHNKSLNIITDRFLSKKIYSSNSSQFFIISNNFINLTKYVLNNNIIKSNLINKNAVFEFLTLRRLFGNKTFFNSISLLSPATIYKINHNKLSEIKYWEPNYGNFLPFNEAYISLAENLRKSTSRYLSQTNKSSILLSGGLDSRALLSASYPGSCITVCPTKNNEANIAEKLSATANVPFHFFLSKEQSFNEILNEVVFESDGEYSLVNASFYAYKDEFEKISELFLLGLFLDVMFGGLYLPKSKIKIGGIDTTINILDKIPNDHSNYFINNVKYKMKNSDIMQLIKENFKIKLFDELHYTINQYFALASKRTSNIYSQWESLHLSPMSRHYSYAMVKSIESFSNCAIPAFDNNLLDLSLNINPKHKVNSSVYKEAIKYLNPDLMGILNANSNIRADYNEYLSTFLIFSKKLLRRSFRIDLGIPPSNIDRSWLSPKKIIEKNPKLIEEIFALTNSDYIKDLEIINKDKLAEIIQEHFNQEYNHSILLQHLVTINILFRKIFNN